MTSFDLPADLQGFFRGLANETRQRILFEVLSDKKPHTVGEVAKRMGIAPSTASEHLSLLRRSGLVEATKKDREVLYTLNKTKIAAQLDFLSHWLTCC